MAPYGTGRTMVNIHGRPGDEPDRARTSEVYARLRRTKAAYDPHNLLRQGHTVSPEAAPA
ncbi:BBE domain-containing protein [Streptomyces sp. NPDC096205]|uniref:BBE domain-containing protein n=1 Tax=Streptomyces sp. NPDC096205 TaxID=3366081 RepID=UPI003828CE67